MPNTLLPDRGVVEVAGADRVGFLQGLVSNDVTLATSDVAIWAALLTPQGKWLADFFVVANQDRLLLDCAVVQAPMLVAHLARFRLRAKVTLRDASAEFKVHAAWGGRAPGISDPRLAVAGSRILSLVPLATDATPEDYDRHRLALGLPDGARDMVAEKSTLLEGGFDELHGVSWTKGCYMGQELTARTKYRGLLKRRLFPVTAEGPLPAPGTPVTRDGVEVGEMRSGRDDLGLALLRIDAMKAALNCGDALLHPRVPAWMVLPAREPA